MILIVANNADDVLYCDSILQNRRVERVMNKFDLVIGSIFDQEIILLKDVYTNIVSAAVTSYIYSHYFVYLTINVGRCTTMSEEIKNGEIIISKRVIPLDANLTNVNSSKVGQLPGFASHYEVNAEILSTFTTAFAKRTFARIHDITLCSASKNFNSREDLNEFIADDLLLGNPINRIAFDNEFAGIALASSLHDIPCIAIKVVERHMGEKETIKNYVKVLNEYVNVGKSIVTAISELSRNEILREGGKANE